MDSVCFGLKWGGRYMAELHSLEKFGFVETNKFNYWFVLIGI